MSLLTRLLVLIILHVVACNCDPRMLFRLHVTIYSFAILFLVALRRARELMPRARAAADGDTNADAGAPQ